MKKILFLTFLFLANICRAADGGEFSGCGRAGRTGVAGGDQDSGVGRKWVWNWIRI